MAQELLGAGGARQTDLLKLSLALEPLLVLRSQLQVEQDEDLLLRLEALRLLFYPFSMLLTLLLGAPLSLERSLDVSLLT